MTVTAGQDDDTADDAETLTHTASGGGYGSVAEDLPVTVDDDDEPGLVLSKSSLGPAEGASESYTVALATQPTGQVTVTITGHSGTDLTLGETSLTFTTTNWSTAQTVTVTAGQDDDTADDEETLTHTASGGGYGSVAEDLPVTVDDDDVPGLVLSKSSLGPAEGASESYTVALATQPSGQVTVTITGHSGTDLTLGETSLTFTTTNWSTAQTVTVTAGQDDDTADDEETLTHTASGGGYGSVAEDLPVTVDDDDVPGLVLSKSSLGPAEGASESYTVALATQPTGQVTVTITGHSGTDLTLGRDEPDLHHHELVDGADGDGDGGPGRRHGGRRGDADAHRVGRRLRVGGRGPAGDGGRRRRAGAGAVEVVAGSGGGGKRELHGGACDAADGPGDGDDHGPLGDGPDARTRRA